MMEASGNAPRIVSRDLIQEDDYYLSNRYGELLLGLILL